MNGLEEAFHCGDSIRLTGSTTPQSVWKTQRGRNDWGGGGDDVKHVCVQNESWLPSSVWQFGWWGDRWCWWRGERRNSDGLIEVEGEGGGQVFSSPDQWWGAGEGVDFVSSLLNGGDASLLLLGQGHELRMGHEVVDGATGLWALQPRVQGATERIHHLNLKQREETNVRGGLVSGQPFLHKQKQNWQQGLMGHVAVVRLNLGTEMRKEKKHNEWNSWMRTRLESWKYPQNINAKKVNAGGSS